MSWPRLSSLALGLACFTSLSTAANIEVTVGKDSKLEFNPSSIKAQIGDTITYKFFSKNHAVAQSTFADPCHIQANGIFSGFTPNTSPDVAAPTDFTITINDTKPLWFYCPQTNGNHCQSGMVHAINAPDTGNTFDAYKAKAQGAATPSTPPAGTLPVGGLRKLHIDVGSNGELMFNPNNVTELVGTVVEFSYNPMNHSIVQSSFDKPCQPIDRPGGGFAAPFVPTQQTPSGVTFEVTLTNTDPIWFYCAQTKKSHCQSGMVGSINAAATGDKTFQAFKDLAAKAPPSTITPDTPEVGALKVNGTFIGSIGGTVLDTTTLDPSLGNMIPPPDMNYPPYIGGMAGGNQPSNYNWGDNITDEAVAILQALQYIDNFIVVLLLEGFNQMSQGQWSSVYPGSITQTLGSLVAQSLVHRRTYTDSLQHFNKDVVSRQHRPRTVARVAQQRIVRDAAVGMQPAYRNQSVNGADRFGMRAERMCKTDDLDLEGKADRGPRERRVMDEVPDVAQGPRRVGLVDVSHAESPDGGVVHGRRETVLAIRTNYIHL
ncbi:hypothetical protein ONZ43_g6028 [Nemania bipapillata]|uniref:Uncharacterized protein n=1 Tax=Nemania bipapillata TaxID=110536 RepID=A0ACC2I3C8_9PEZI|nr:hypothetical protein ONZ43_g6028 [Nemania bipapillata]